MSKLEMAFAGVIIFILLSGLYAVAKQTPDRASSPCKEFASWELKDVPARCVKSFIK